MEFGNGQIGSEAERQSPWASCLCSWYMLYVHAYSIYEVHKKVKDIYDSVTFLCSVLQEYRWHVL